MPMSVEQCRAARALLDWSTNALADAAKLGLATVRRFETDKPVQQSSIDAMRQALEAAGVLFIESGQASNDGGEGVRLVRASQS